MTKPRTFSLAIEFLPNWLAETNDTTALGRLLTAWAQTCDWQSCGVILPTDGTEPLTQTIHAGVVTATSPPPETPDALRRIRAGEQIATYPVTGKSGRTFVGLQPPGRPLGLLWVEREVTRPVDENEQAYLLTTAKLAERSPAVAALSGPVVDPERLNQRLGDAAVIAGRMAHDFDNILTGIIGFSDLALPLIQSGSQAAGFVAEIGKVGQRGIVFTQQLHQLSRSGQVKPNPTTLPMVLAKEEVRVKPLLGANIRFEKQSPDSLPAVALEAGPLQTMLAHLIDNAVEACSQGGTVRVTAELLELAEADARSFLGKPGTGPHLLVSVSDTGTGIKPEVRRRLFAEPFYTTKVRHRGLGLAIVYRVLCAHKGGIRLEPAPPPGPGTLVRVVLPTATTRPATAGSPTGHAASVGPVSVTAVRG